MKENKNVKVLSKHEPYISLTQSAVGRLFNFFAIMQSNITIMSIQRNQYPVIASAKPDILREAVSKYIDHFYPK